MTHPTIPAPAWGRPAAQGGTRRKEPVRLALFPFGVHRPASTVHRHAGTRTAEWII
jgi:hypothetical protein